VHTVIRVLFWLTQINLGAALGIFAYLAYSNMNYFYDRLPKHDKSKYNTSSASHRDVPQASFESALEWIKGAIK